MNLEIRFGKEKDGYEEILDETNKVWRIYPQGYNLNEAIEYLRECEGEEVSSMLNFIDCCVEDKKFCKESLLRDVSKLYLKESLKGFIPTKEYLANIDAYLKVAEKEDFEDLLYKNDEFPYVYKCKGNSVDVKIQVCYATLSYGLENGKLLKKCSECGRYFITNNRTDEKYCNMGNPDLPKKCSEVAKDKQQAKRQEGQEETLRRRMRARVTKAYNREKDDDVRAQFDRLLTDFGEAYTLYKKEGTDKRFNSNSLIEFLTNWDNRINEELGRIRKGKENA